MASIIIGSTMAAGTLRLGDGVIKTVGSNDSWKETSGRENGPEGYKFGDMTKSIWNSFWGSESKDKVAIATATPLDTEKEQISHLQNELLKIQEDIDKYEEDEEDNEAILTYLKTKKQQIKQQIKQQMNLI